MRVAERSTFDDQIADADDARPHIDPFTSRDRRTLAFTMKGRMSRRHLRYCRENGSVFKTAACSTGEIHS
ncbi:hypothetical protein [Actinoallomurus soli]|uniref:hypothetical protein n=1 Tax=Actinoallomurus soli TaxID=2952535 RepID=UPI00209401B6|nr:hypothetical protein [Actinoallomurus soli]MCO5971436.1 hypothetical protein [Actinoallomurus soli]